MSAFPVQQDASTPETLNTDVLIVGMGPSGATLANLLGQRGQRVVIVDQAEAIYDKPRAITADQESLRVFQEIGLAEEINACTTPHPGTDFVGLRGQVIKRFYPAPPPEPLAWAPSFMFVQPELEATLRRGLKRYPQVTALTAHTYVNLNQDADGVVATLHRQSDGQSVTVQARYVVAADGATSTIRKQWRAPIEDLAFDEWWIVVDAWIRGPVQLPERCVQYCRPSRPGTYIVGPGDLRRWEIKILPGERPEDFQSHEAVWSVLGEFVDTHHLAHCRTAIYRFHALVVETWRQGRVFLMGDAAHQMPPFLGQGLGAGVRDAYNLAWKLDAVLRQRAQPALLDTYGPERKRHVRTVVGHAKNFGLIIGELDVERARQRDAKLEAELQSGAAVTVRQKFIPGLETGLLHHTPEGALGQGAGALCIQPWVRSSADQTWRRLDDLTGGRFALITTSVELLNAMTETDWAAWQALDAAAVLISTVSQQTTQVLNPLAHSSVAFQLQERDGLLSAWLAEQGATALLARPDHYVYGLISDLSGLRQLHNELTTQGIQTC
jgi:3-(3-hydroxy-phenyl)propionate hydroxylase